jgi:hypothetical protein
MNHPYLERISRILIEQGDLYDVADLFREVEMGEAQSFAEGDSLIITSIRVFPKRKALEVRLAVGALGEIYAMQPRIVEFARENGCDRMIASVGREGWEMAATPGWKKAGVTWVREI